jgi:hypothetical protein
MRPVAAAIPSRLRFCTSLLILGALAVDAQTPDPAQTLAAARSRVLATLDKVGAISCIETIQRSYLRPSNPAHASCDQLHVDFKRGRIKENSYATDRLHLRVFIDSGSEVDGWIDSLPFEWHTADEVRLTGPIGTGPLAGFLSSIFVTSGTTIEFTGAGDGGLEYRFRKTERASNYSARAGNEWVTTGNGGTFFIDPASLILQKLVVETSTLPPETSACESNTSVSYAIARIGADDVLLPREAEWQNLLPDGGETVSRVTYSSCAAVRPPAPSSHAAPAFPPNLPIRLAFDAAIDLDTAAVGDIVSATVTAPVSAPHSPQPLVGIGAKARGRILNLEHRPDRGGFFLVAISFDTLESGPGAVPVHMVLEHGFNVDDPISTRATTGGVVVRHPARWPELTLVVRDNRHTIPAGFQSKWVTAK